ncbi:hypothetical protein HMI56_003097 [Coelomomyces lativittatus]|nr:hypothetical protein HMI56_003097 [Coelomomyces lativittatus]
MRTGYALGVFLSFYVQFLVVSVSSSVDKSYFPTTLNEEVTNPYTIPTGKTSPNSVIQSLPVGLAPHPSGSYASNAPFTTVDKTDALSVTYSPSPNLHGRPSTSSSSTATEAVNVQKPSTLTPPSHPLSLSAEPLSPVVPFPSPLKSPLLPHLSSATNPSVSLPLVPFRSSSVSISPRPIPMDSELSNSFISTDTITPVDSSISTSSSSPLSPFSSGSDPLKPAGLNKVQKCVGLPPQVIRLKYPTLTRPCEMNDEVCADDCAYYTCVGGTMLVPMSVSSGTKCQQDGPRIKLVF